MNLPIPLHCLLLLTADADIARCVPAHEYLQPAAILRDLVGSARAGLESIALLELRRRLDLKLALGERVVVDATTLSHDQQLALLRCADAQGATVIVATTARAQGHRLRQAMPSLHTLDLPARDLGWVGALPDDPLATLVAAGWRGLTIVADVHGMRVPLRRALDWAQSRRHFVWLLGDLIDHGPDGLGCVEDAYHLVMTGAGALILANHERKLARWLAAREQGSRLPTLSAVNQRTVARLQALPSPARQRWQGRFRALLARTFALVHLGSLSLAHAACHPDVWRAGDDVDGRAIERFALFGEPDRRVPPPGFALAHDWVDQVPSGQLVIVGHDTRSTVAPLAVSGSRGGRVVFLDTGCGKGGPLCSADVRFDGPLGLHLENFNSHGLGDEAG